MSDHIKRLSLYGKHLLFGLKSNLKVLKSKNKIKDGKTFYLFIELISFTKETPCGRVQAGAAALQERENKNKIKKLFFFKKLKMK